MGVAWRGARRYQRLLVQMWDKDLISANDMIGETTLKLDKWFKRLYRKKTTKVVPHLGPEAKLADPAQWGVSLSWEIV